MSLSWGSVVYVRFLFCYLFLFYFIFLEGGFFLFHLRHLVALAIFKQHQNWRYVCKQLVSSILHAGGPCVIMNNHHVPEDIQGAAPASLL